MELDDRQQQMCDSHDWDFSALRAMVINCTLKPPRELSHTQGLIDIPIAIMEANGVTVDQLRAVDQDLPAGV